MKSTNSKTYRRNLMSERRIMEICGIFSVIIFIVYLKFYVATDTIRNNCDSRINFESLQSSFESLLDQRVLNYIRCHHLTPGSKAQSKLKLSDKIHRLEIDPIQNLFKNWTSPGFFIEANAKSGFKISPTLALEQNFGWSGLLVEPNRKYLPLLEKDRKAWISDICLSTRNRIFKIVSQPTDSDGSGAVECFPLESLMGAVGVNQVDLLSLSLAGNELEVLKSFPWSEERCIIQVILVNFQFVPEGAEGIELFLIKWGYQLVGETGENLIFLSSEFQGNRDEKLIRNKRI